MAATCVGKRSGSVGGGPGQGGDNFSGEARVAAADVTGQETAAAEVGGDSVLGGLGFGVLC